MTVIVVMNVVLCSAVLTGIVGLLLRSITTQEGDAPRRRVPLAPFPGAGTSRSKWAPRSTGAVSWGTSRDRRDGFTFALRRGSDLLRDPTAPAEGPSRGGRLRQ